MRREFSGSIIGAQLETMAIIIIQGVKNNTVYLFIYLFIHYFIIISTSRNIFNHENFLEHYYII